MGQKLGSLRNIATKFRILVEIVANQPFIHQRTIAEKLGITPQAVSEHIKELIEEGFITTSGRSKYRVTKEGVDFIIKRVQELREYTSFVEKIVNAMMVCAAVADAPLKKGEEVRLRMKDGLLFACKEGEGARAKTICDAEPGEDVGVSEIDGMVDLKPGKVRIFKVPGIERGGSRKLDLERLRREIEGKSPIGVIGLEALAGLRKIGVEPQYLYGVKEAAIEAAHCGLTFYLLCAENELSSFLRRLEEEGVEYEVLELEV